MFILPVAAFFLFLLVCFDRKRKLVESVVVSWLFITFDTWFYMELSSVFGLLNTVTALLFWGILCLCLAVYSFKNRLFYKLAAYGKSNYNLSGCLREHKVQLICLFVFCTLICMLSLLRSQNLIDNLYHRLSKIMHWIQNGRVGYFVTVTPGEIKYSNLTEYMNAQIYLLKGPDRLLNLVQSGAYLCSGVFIYGIARKLGAARKFAFLSVWIFALTPMVIVETLTTQTDVVAGSYLLSFVYLLLDYIHADKLKMGRKEILSAVCLSASVGFGYLAKPTVCFAMVIFFLWMCVVRIARRDKAVVLLQYVLVGAACAAVLIAPGIIREYQYRNIPNLYYEEAPIEAESGSSGDESEQSGQPDESESVTTESSQQQGEEPALEEEGTVDTQEAEEAQDVQAVQEEGQPEQKEDQRVDNTTVANTVIANLSKPKEFVIVCIRNLATVSTSRCFPKINHLLQRFVEKCESFLNYSGGYRYFRVLVEEGFGETSEPSPAIMFFLSLSWLCAVFRISKIKGEQFLYLLFGTAALVVQAGLMGYTWYNQRYLLGVMALICPVFGVVLEKIAVGIGIRLNMAIAMITLCCFGTANALSYEIPYVVFGFQGEKIHQYLFHDSGAETYYRMILDYVNEKGYKTVGMTGSISYEYVLWREIEGLERMEHVNVNPAYFDTAKLSDPQFRPQCIIEELPEQYGLDEILYCYDQLYVLDWCALGDNGKNYAVLVPYGE